MLARSTGGTQADWSATERQLRAWFSGGGLADVTVQQLDIDVDLPAVRSYVPRHLRALPWSASFFDLPEDEQVAALTELDSELAEYRTDQGLRVPFSSYLVTATI